MKKSKTFGSFFADASPRELKTFCKVVSQACNDGLLLRQQAKTLIGQAKHGELDAAMRGLRTIMER